MDRCFHLDEATLRILGVRLLALLDHIDTFDHSALLVDKDFHDLTGLAFVFACEDVNGVALLICNLLIDVLTC